MTNFYFWSLKVIYFRFSEWLLLLLFLCGNLWWKMHHYFCSMWRKMCQNFPTTINFCWACTAKKKKENCHSSIKDDTYKNGQIVSVTNYYICKLATLQVIVAFLPIRGTWRSRGCMVGWGWSWMFKPVLVYRSGGLFVHAGCGRGDAQRAARP